VQRGPHYLDVGFRVRAPAVLDEAGQPRDLTDATVTEILAKRPGGIEVNPSWQGEADATTGVVAYETQAEDLDEPGTWQIQAHVVLEDGSEYHGPVGIMRVEGVLTGDTGIPEGVSSHAARHHAGGPDPLVLQDASSGEAVADRILVSDGSGGWTLEEQAGGLAAHAETHHHDGADPIDVEDLRSRYADIRVLMAGVVDDFSEPAPNRVEGVPFFDVFIPALQASLQVRPLPLGTFSYSATSFNATTGHHWSYRRGTRTGGASVISFRGTGGDSPLPAGWWAIYEQTGVGGWTEIQGTEGMVLAPESDFLDAAGTKAVLETGERAIVYVRATNELVVVRHGGVPRLRAGTITGDETYQIAHHGQQRRYAISSPATVTFVPARRGDVVVYDHMGAVADVLSFAFDGVTPVIQPGLVASISANGTVVARYLASGTVDLSGALDVAP
jgi:hypothetical protein